MEEERSSLIDIVGDVTKALPEASTGSSLSDASSGEAASDAAKADIEDITDPDKLARSYDFGASLVTVRCIRQLECLGYFVESSAREPREETVPEPNTYEVVIFEEFFGAGLRMLPHPAFTKILLKLWVQLYQLTLNAITQISKNFWVMLSFSGEPSSDGFAMCYELHYHAKKVPVNGFEKFEQFGIINFHGKQGGEAGLAPAMKNEWSAGWMKAWFYCKAPLRVCPRGATTVHTLRSHISTLNFCMKPSVQDSVQDLSDDAFIWACKNIGGQDVVEEFVSCGVWPLSASVDFEQVKVDLTPVS
jgi:hypothetical protein